jgi:sialate O-acetylesterase
MKLARRLGLGILGFSLLCTGPLRADVRLPSIFSSHAVLNKSAATPIWGWADAGEAVAVRFGSVTAQAHAGEDGRWKASLDLSGQDAGPHDLTVDGKNHLVVPDVVVGHVWLCSGQSNMVLFLDQTTGAKEEVAQSANPQLREFTAISAFSETPLDDVKGTWQLAAPDTTPHFSAVAYYFGKEMQADLKTPIGLVLSAYGGSPAEAWTSREALATGPEFDAEAKEIAAAQKAFPPLQDAYVHDLAAWEDRFGRKDPAGPGADTSAWTSGSTAGWTPMTLPGSFAAAGLPASGVIWVKRTITITPDLLGHGVGIQFGVIPGFETVYFNGHKIGETLPSTPGAAAGAHHCLIPKEMVLGGPATLAIRIHAPFGNGGVFGMGGKILLGLANLGGSDWFAKAESSLPPPSPESLAALPKPPPAPVPEKNTPALLFDGMIAPLIPYGIDGVAWYQGEANVDHASEYRRLFPLLIKDWRGRWGEGDLPFLFCQLANYTAKDAQPGDGPWAYLREAQASALVLPHTGMAVLIDLGEELDIHFRDKADVGDRLARLALAKVYGQQIAWSGPVFESMSVQGNAVRIHFAHAESGLRARPLPATYTPRSTAPETVPLVRHAPGGDLEGFAICGADHKWRWAAASISGQDILVQSADVLQPIAVRYAWGNNPTCNLYNGDNLPAAPFRTDNFPSTTGNE